MRGVNQGLHIYKQVIKKWMYARAKFSTFIDQDKVFDSVTKKRMWSGRALWCALGNSATAE